MKTKNFVAAIIAFVVVTMLTITAFAADGGEITAYNGISGTAYDAYYAINGVEAFCIEPTKNHAETGMEYANIGTVENNAVLENIAINLYTNTTYDRDELSKAATYAVWSAVDTSVNYRLQYKANGGNADLYRYLVSDPQNDELAVTITAFSTNDENVQDVVTFNVTTNSPTITPTTHIHVENTREVDRVEPTCTSDGYVVYEVYCTDCGDVLDIKQDVIPAHGHDYELKEHVDATCTEDGYDYYECTYDASHNYTETIKAHDHDYKLKETVEATCTQDGYKYYECTYDASHNYTETIPAHNHNYELKEHVDATCTEDGYDYYECTYDASHNYKEEIPAIGHDYKVAQVVEPTCEQDGYTYYECAHDASHNYTVAIPATGHDYQVKEHVDAQPGKDGYTYYECSHDASHNYTVVEPALPVEETVTTTAEETNTSDTPSVTTTYATPSPTGNKVLSATEDKAAVQTGVKNNAVWIIIFILALCAILYFLYRRKKENENDNEKDDNDKSKPKK